MNEELRMRELKFRAWNERLNKMEQDIGHSLEYHIQHYPVMQFTGLKDKDGVEIYEGDIIKWYGELMTIEWDDVFAGYNMVTPSGWGHTRFTAGDSEEAEVIGNIYENPGLVRNEG